MTLLELKEKVDKLAEDTNKLCICPNSKLIKTFEFPEDTYLDQVEEYTYLKDPEFKKYRILLKKTQEDTMQTTKNTFFQVKMNLEIFYTSNSIHLFFAFYKLP